MSGSSSSGPGPNCGIDAMGQQRTNALQKEDGGSALRFCTAK
jgi:hypothetical protein